MNTTARCLVLGLAMLALGLVACEKHEPPPAPAYAPPPIVAPVAQPAAKHDSRRSAAPIPPSGTQLTIGLDELKTIVRARAKTAADLPPLFSTTVYQNARLNELTFAKDAVVADIGCGPGAMVVDFLLRDRPFGKLIAVDVDQPSLEILAFLLDEYFPAKKNRVELVRSRLNDVMLPPASVDTAILNDAHFFVDAAPGQGSVTTAACLASLRRAIKPGGLVHVWESVAGAEASADHPFFARSRDPFTRVGFEVESAGIDRFPDHAPFVYLALRPGAN
jgi:SAM-dependent methyltransferase